ncbi:SDR family oxidoreductase [Candidatus Woesearchaeota archaeon]|nr:SDR family oxidoreductase [Candidatus Woesearchaeota archaeon]
MKKMLILGVTGVLGKAVAEIAKSRSWDVVGTYRRACPEDKFFDGVAMHKLDMASKISIGDFLKEVEGVQWDAVVNTVANTLFFNRFEKTPPEVFEQDMKINVLGWVSVLQGILPSMKRDASIIFVLTQMVGNAPKKYFSSYTASKYALLGLMYALADEYPQIRWNAVSPGLFDSGYIKGLPEMMKESYRLKYRNLVDPHDIAREVLRLIGDRASNGRNSVILPK